MDIEKKAKDLEKQVNDAIAERCKGVNSFYHPNLMHLVAEEILQGEWEYVDTTQLHKFPTIAITRYNGQ